MHHRRYVCALGAALALTIANAGPASAAPCASKVRASKDVSHAVVCLINAERKQAGVRKLQRRARLNKAAFGQSDRMELKNVFSHLLGGNPVTRILGTGYARGSHSWEIGETIAWVRPGDGPAAAVRGWMTSAYHRSILLDPEWRDVGLGTVKGAPYPGKRGGYTVTATFGRR